MFSKNKIKSLLSRPEFSALAIFIFLLVVFTFTNDRFLNSRNFMVILSTYPELALVALGITILMISGEFDLSVGSVFAVSPIVTMILIADYELHYILSILLGLLAAAFIGLINAVVTIKFKIPSFIATLGMLFMARSIAVVISGGFPPSVPKDLPTDFYLLAIDPVQIESN